MKNLVFTLLVALAIPFVAESKSLKARSSYKTFYAPETGSYMEAYLSVSGSSVIFKASDNGKFTGAIEVSYSFSNSSGVVYTDKYNLLSPEITDTTQVAFNFLDQKRVQLANGKYEMELTIKDNNDPEAQPYTLKQPVVLEYYNNIAAISDIELVDTFTASEDDSHPLYKNGFIVIPFANNYYPPSMATLRFYAEIYNTTKILGDNQPYLISYFIRTYESKRVLSEFSAFKKQNSQPVSILMGEFPITALPSGNYELVVEIKNRDNEFIAGKEVFFQRSNTIFAAEDVELNNRSIDGTFVANITDKDSLIGYIRSTRPISNQLEVTFLNNQLKLADEVLMQRYLYDFWSKRNPLDPEKAFTDYRNEVAKVNNEFSTHITPGYDSERGRVYLQYGAPNTISKNYNEPSAYPYEVWHYYKIGSQSNRKFVFYNPDLVSNEFELLHSDAQGEMYDYQWQNKLHSRDTQTRDIDSEGLNQDDYFGNHSKDMFENPR